MAGHSAGNTGSDKGVIRLISQGAKRENDFLSVGKKADPNSKSAKGFFDKGLAKMQSEKTILIIHNPLPVCRG